MLCCLIPPLQRESLQLCSIQYANCWQRCMSLNNILSASSTTLPSMIVININAKILTHYRGFLRLLFPALFKAMATACFWGRPSLCKVLIFLLTAFRVEPRFNGMVSSLCSGHPFLLRPFLSFYHEKSWVG